MGKVQLVSWPCTPESDTGLTVARIEPTDYLRYAPAVLRLLATDYNREFGPDAPSGYQLLSAGAGQVAFDADSPEKCREQASRMARNSRKFGTAYWAAHPTAGFEPGDTLLGAAKARGARSRLHRPGAPPNCYVEDIALAHKRRDVSAGLLWAALSDFDESVRVTIDTLPITSRLLFRSLADPTHSGMMNLVYDGVRLPQGRFKRSSVWGTREALVENEGWLQTSTTLHAAAS